MNILFLSPEYSTPENPSGGLGVYIRKTATALVQRGHRVVVLVLSNRAADWRCNGVLIVEVAAAPAFRGMHRLYGLPRYALFLWDRWKMRRATLRLHKEVSFDVIQVASYAATGVLLPRSLPVVCRLSSLESLLREAYGHPLHGIDRLLSLFECWQCRNARAVFSPSHFIAQKAQEQYGVAADVIRSIPCASGNLHGAPDTTFFERHLSGKRYLLYFGQLSRIKGMDVLAEALPSVLSAVLDIHIVFIGRDDGLPPMASCQQHITSKLDEDLAARVHFFPPQPHTVLMPCIANSLCVLQPTRMDNLPNTCIEALMLAKGVVASTPSSLEELIADGVNGWLFPNGDAFALAAVVISVLRGERPLTAPGFLPNFYIQDPITQLEQFYAAHITV